MAQASLTQEERDAVESFAVPDGYERVARPVFWDHAQLVGYYVLMRFQRSRRTRVDGNPVTVQWSEWSLGKVVKQRTAPGSVDIMWPDVGRRTSKLDLDQYGGGSEDGPGACWVFCRKL